MKKRHLILLFLTFICAIPPVQADHNHDEHARNEIGVGINASYEINHHEWTPALHLHYFRTLSAHSRWALGGGIEYLNGDEKHLELGLGVRCEPVSHLHISLIPGITITDHPRFSIHTEAVYEWLHFGQFHLGPMIGYGWSKGHSHLSAGVHAAISF